jgi:hypothetical protein
MAHRNRVTSGLFWRNRQFGAELQLVWIGADGIFVRIIDTPPLGWIAVELLRDGRQRVARLNFVRLGGRRFRGGRRGGW